MKKRVADIIMDTLVEYGITDCFAVVGGGAMHLDHALLVCKAMKSILIIMNRRVQWRRRHMQDTAGKWQRYVSHVDRVRPTP